MATSKERDKEHPKGHLAMKTPPIVSQQEWEAARQQLLVKEGLDPLPRCAGCRASTDAVDGGGEEVRVRRAQGQG